MLRVLVAVAHPDDETLMCGGTLARHAAASDRVFTVTFTNGVGARAWPLGNDSAIRDRWSAFHRAMATLGVIFGHDKALEDSGWFSSNDGSGWQREDMPDNELDTIPLLRLVRRIEESLMRFQPHIVYTHHPADLNVDHRQVAQAVLVATRPAVSRVRAVYAGETASSTECAFGALPFVPDMFVQLSAIEMNRKLDALACYGSEIRQPPHPRSIDGIARLAAYRGATVGAQYAEAFETLRRVARLEDSLC